ncbi:trans-aconitate 2-methyltransferase [Actinopolymorpha singaporensis]|uniref:Trans-aconitate 2-methyltransferase n=1 Tax=Actinopolymorpha singaporensis TaxID=117157 RepID=A0A1H1L5F6_9ACTN|nr:trans-aconitate 2-methyltransferase [Actinopolymorpha singaporensis]SDR69149.1 trans-aconitate 2-methyltransferase [Actinopolymorpha singaporensis]
MGTDDRPVTGGAEQAAGAGGLRWDPRQYLKYADERGRPFADLVARVAAPAPAYVVDLGCGPGNLTATLAGRWPDARIEGIDSSPEMIDRAQDLARGLAGETSGRLSFRLGDAHSWVPDRPVDVLVTNATLQWVPGHEALLPTWVGHLAPGGWLALQVPGNFDSPTHRILFDLAAEEPWATHLAGRVRQRAAAPGAEEYLALLAGAGCEVEAWETTYLHVLPGENAVFEWIRGTGARPVLQALPDDVRPEFEKVYKERLAAAYPRRDYGTVLPFRRVFAVAHRAAS